MDSIGKGGTWLWMKKPLGRALPCFKNSKPLAFSEGCDGELFWNMNTRVLSEPILLLLLLLLMSFKKLSIHSMDEEDLSK